MLGRIENFTPEEAACALELVDVALEKPDQPDYLFLLAEEDGELLGYICYGPTAMTEGTFDLYWIASDPHARKKGAGTKLLLAMEADLKKRGARLVRVETSSKEDYGGTHAFYEKHKYVEESRLRDFYRPGDDLITLTKRF
jgi:ribosomal protein S18 acetylase RimI-like enzyme